MTLRPLTQPDGNKQDHTKLVPLHAFVALHAFIIGMASSVRNMPLEEFSNPSDQLCYERGRQFAILARQQWPARRIMEGKRPAAWVADAYGDMRRQHLIL